MEESWYDKLMGSFGKQDGILSTNSNLRGGLDIGLGLANYFQEGDKNKMYKTALEDQLKNSKMQRQLASDQVVQQAGVQKSLAGAFGESTSPYDKRIDRFRSYLA